MTPNRLARGVPTALAVAVVVLAYAFFATRGTLNFARLRDTEISFYVQLQQGFEGGHLYMLFPVDERILALSNPYDPKARASITFYPWDASYFNGHYYLYYSPLPVLLGYMPVYLLTHQYVADELIAALFCTWAFLAMLMFVRQALSVVERPRVPFFLWVLFLGLGNAVPFVLTSVHTYEVAIATGMAMTASWALSVLRLLRAPSAARALWMGVWLALAIAARPDLVILGVPAAVVLVLAFRTRGAQLVRAACLFAVPLVIAGAAMLWYNAARFSDPLEFGVRYQLTSVDMAGQRLCGVRSLGEAMRMVNNVWHYVFYPPVARGAFPFLDALAATLDPAVTWPTSGMTEPVIGLAPLMPLAMIGSALALLFAFVWPAGADARVRASIVVMASAWLILAGLSTCWWIVARYSLEFMLLMAGAAIVLTEYALSRMPPSFVARMLIVALAIYSVGVGFLLGLSGPGGAFRRANAPLIRRLTP